MSPEEAIVVVGDTAQHREDLAEHLRAAGLSSVQTMAAADALLLLSQQRPAVVVLDLNRLEPGDSELLAGIRGVPSLSESSIVVLLSSSSSEELERAFALGADDCTARADAIEHIARVKNQLRQKERLTTRLRQKEAELATVAHDLNQPLTSVMGYGEVLARQIGETTPLAHAARMIVSEAERMAKIVRRLAKRKPHTPPRGDGVGEAE